MPSALLEFGYLCRDCGKPFTLHATREDFLDAVPACPACASINARRYEPSTLTSDQHTTLANSTFKLAGKYPYVSNRLSLRMPGYQHNHLGKTIVPSRQAEREIMAQYGYRRE